MYDPLGIVFEPTNRYLYIADTGNYQLIVHDAQIVGFSIGTHAVSAVEGGAAVTVPVRLNSIPTGNVRITVSSPDPAAVTAMPATMTFTAGNWNIPQNITVTAVADADLDDESMSVTASVDDEASDNAYDVLTDQTIAVNVADPDYPAIPVITSPEDGDASSGTISGTGLAGNSINVTGPGSSSCSTVVAGDNTWSCTLTSLPVSGTAGTVSATQIQSGKTSTASTPISITIDTASPVAPAISSPVSSEVVADSTPTVSGTAEVGSTVNVRESATTLCTAVADGLGDWSCVSSALNEGQHAITVAAVDSSGNIGNFSLVREFTVDSSTPIISRPTTSLLTNDSTLEIAGTALSGMTVTVAEGVNASVLSDSTPIVSGTAEADSSISVLRDGNQLCQATADNSGLWSCTVGALSDGSYLITATATDLAGNRSPASVGRTFIIRKPVSTEGDFDGDGVSDRVEKSAFNGGDGNGDGDGIADSLQNTVASVRNVVTGGSTTLVASCPVTYFAVVSDDSVLDKGFVYPVGLVDFRLACSTVGATATIAVFYDRHVGGSGQWRKGEGGAYSQVSGVDIGVVSRLPNVTAVSYTITDGGALDTDRAANGTIADPAGLAQRSNALSTTGMPLTALALTALILLTTAALWLWRTTRLST